MNECLSFDIAESEKRSVFLLNHSPECLFYDTELSNLHPKDSCLSHAVIFNGDTSKSTKRPGTLPSSAGPGRLMVLPGGLLLSGGQATCPWIGSIRSDVRRQTWA